jgi:hypothetical protein
MRRMVSFFLGVVLGTTTLVFASSSVAAPAARNIVAQLTVFSDGTAVGVQGSIGLVAGHSFITVKNTSRSPISVGGLHAIAPLETVSVGSWGNKMEHEGLWYNLESYMVHQNASMYATASLTRQLTTADLTTLNDYILKHDSYDVVTNNCSSFASRAWNTVSPLKLSIGLPNTPTGLFLAIGKVKGAEYGTAVNIPWTSRGVWHANGKKAPVRSLSFTGAAPKITFDEVAVGTSVTKQYAAKGVLFAGSPGPVTSLDGDNPSAPVLSPGPGFSGNINITFVSPKNPSKPTSASDVAFDIGYMNTANGASISWYTAKGKLLGKMSTKDLGIVRVLIPGVALARVHIDTTADPAGAAIDNLEFSLN